MINRARRRPAKKNLLQFSLLFVSAEILFSHLEHRGVLVLCKDLVGHLDLFLELSCVERKKKTN